MSVNPEVQVFLDKLAKLPSPATLTPVEMRERFEKARGMKVDAHIDCEALNFDIGDIADRLSARLYRSAASSKGVLPGLCVFVHGGGLVLGDVDSYDDVCRRLCVNSGHCILSINYTLAPELKWPGQLTQCEKVISWALENSDTLQFDSKNIMICGDSAGGLIATALAQTTKFEFQMQVLVYPITDLSLVFAPEDKLTESYKQFGSGRHGLSIETMQWYMDHFMDWKSTNKAHISNNITLCPLHSPDTIIAKLPRTFIITAECDILRDEAEQYAQKLKKNGVKCEIARVLGQIHGFFNMINEGFDDALTAIDNVSMNIKRALDVAMNESIKNSHKAVQGTPEKGQNNHFPYPTVTASTEKKIHSILKKAQGIDISVDVDSQSQNKGVQFQSPTQSVGSAAGYGDSFNPYVDSGDVNMDMSTMKGKRLSFRYQQSEPSKERIDSNNYNTEDDLEESAVIGRDTYRRSGLHGDNEEILKSAEKALRSTVDRGRSTGKGRNKETNLYRGKASTRNKMNPFSYKEYVQDLEESLMLTTPYDKVTPYNSSFRRSRSMSPGSTRYDHVPKSKSTASRYVRSSADAEWLNAFVEIKGMEREMDMQERQRNYYAWLAENNTKLGQREYREARARSRDPTGAQSPSVPSRVVNSSPEQRSKEAERKRRREEAMLIRARQSKEYMNKVKAMYTDPEGTPPMDKEAKRNYMRRTGRSKSPGRIQPKVESHLTREELLQRRAIIIELKKEREERRVLKQRISDAIAHTVAAKTKRAISKLPHKQHYDIHDIARVPDLTPQEYKQLGIKWLNAQLRQENAAKREMTRSLSPDEYALRYAAEYTPISSKQPISSTNIAEGVELHYRNEHALGGVSTGPVLTSQSIKQASMKNNNNNKTTVSRSKKERQNAEELNRELEAAMNQQTKFSAAASERFTNKNNPYQAPQYATQKKNGAVVDTRAILDMVNSGADIQASSDNYGVSFQDRHEEDQEVMNTLMGTRRNDDSDDDNDDKRTTSTGSIDPIAMSTRQKEEDREAKLEAAKSKYPTVTHVETNFVKQLQDIYSVFNPDKLGTVSMIIDSFEGSNRDLLEQICNKYDIPCVLAPETPTTMANVQSQSSANMGKTKSKKGTRASYKIESTGNKSLDNIIEEIRIVWEYGHPGRSHKEMNTALKKYAGREAVYLELLKRKFNVVDDDGTDDALSEEAEFNVYASSRSLKQSHLLDSKSSKSMSSKKASYGNFMPLSSLKDAHYAVRSTRFGQQSFRTGYSTKESSPSVKGTKGVSIANKQKQMLENLGYVHGPPSVRTKRSSMENIQSLKTGLSKKTTNYTYSVKGVQPDSVKSSYKQHPQQISQSTREIDEYGMNMADSRRRDSDDESNDNSNKQPESMSTYIDDSKSGNITSTGSAAAYMGQNDDNDAATGAAFGSDSDEELPAFAGSTRIGFPGNQNDLHKVHIKNEVQPKYAESTTSTKKGTLKTMPSKKGTGPGATPAASTAPSMKTGLSNKGHTLNTSSKKLDSTSHTTTTTDVNTALSSSTNPNETTMAASNMDTSARVAPMGSDSDMDSDDELPTFAGGSKKSLKATLEHGKNPSLSSNGTASKIVDSSNQQGNEDFHRHVVDYSKPAKDFQHQLYEIYSIYAPDNIKNIPVMLQTFDNGREQELLDLVHLKYNIPRTATAPYLEGGYVPGNSEGSTSVKQPSTTGEKQGAGANAPGPEMLSGKIGTGYNHPNSIKTGIPITDTAKGKSSRSISPSTKKSTPSSTAGKMISNKGTASTSSKLIEGLAASRGVNMEAFMNRLKNDGIAILSQKSGGMLTSGGLKKRCLKINERGKLFYFSNSIKLMSGNTDKWPLVRLKNVIEKSMTTVDKEGNARVEITLKFGESDEHSKKVVKSDLAFVCEDTTEHKNVVAGFKAVIHEVEDDAAAFMSRWAPSRVGSRSNSGYNTPAGGGTPKGSPPTTPR